MTSEEGPMGEAQRNRIAAPVAVWVSSGLAFLAYMADSDALGALAFFPLV